MCLIQYTTTQHGHSMWDAMRPWAPGPPYFRRTSSDCQSRKSRETQPASNDSPCRTVRRCARRDMRVLSPPPPRPPLPTTRQPHITRHQCVFNYNWCRGVMGALGPERNASICARPPVRINKNQRAWFGMSDFPILSARGAHF